MRAVSPTVLTALSSPVHDRLGQFSPLKATTFALLFLPAVWFAWLGATDGLTPQPLGFVIYRLALASAAASFAFESTWLRFVRGYTEFGSEVELWDLGLGLAATWQVLIVGLSAAALGAVFGDRRLAVSAGRAGPAPRPRAAG